jgi:hypothetical protein
MSLLPAFQWIEATAIAKSINASLYDFAYIEAVHLLALAVLGGATLMVDLRLLGLAMTDQPVTRLYRITRPWFRWSLATILLTGFLLFISLAATKYYYHYYYWVKMYFLAGAIIFTFAVKNRMISNNDAIASTVTGKLIGLVSILLWSGVGLAGKAIGYIS